MAEWKKMQNVEDEDETFDIFVNCCGIALEKELGSKFDRTAADPQVKEEKGETLAADYKAYLSDTLDMETIYKVMEVCAGMKLNDPNLLAAVARATEDGTN
jgi:hypothetical protein